MRKNDKKLKAFVDEVATTLLEGKRHQTSGFGTFTTCARKATADQPACKIAMFRASAELRDHASGGPTPIVTGPHAAVIDVIIREMQSEEGINIPLLGRLAVVPVSGKKPKLIFHGDEALNNRFALS